LTGQPGCTKMGSSNTNTIRLEKIMDNPQAKAAAAAEYLKARIQCCPQVGLLTGTGLGDSARLVRQQAIIDYGDIPNFPLSTVQSHAGRLLAGEVGRRPMIVFQGRFHLYEGYTPAQVTFPIRVMQELGVQVLILTNAAGGLNPQFAAGDVMLINDHINLTGSNPLVGPNEQRWGVRFPDMTHAYDQDLARITRQAAGGEGVSLCTGVYAGLLGPSLETPAEVRFLKTIGADAVGFSTVLEVIAAVHAGMRVLGLATITNINDPNKPTPATVEEIIAVAERTAPRLARLIRAIMEQLP